LAEWLYEAGIGEARAALVSRDRIWKAEIELDDSGPREGTIVGAKLIDRPSNLVLLDSGEQALCENIPRSVTQGARLLVRIVRAAIPELGRPKLARAMPAAQGAVVGEGPDLLARILASDQPVRRLQPHETDLLEQAGWSELLEEAASGEIGFAGGALRMSVTPAMTLFDVDGPPPLGALAVQAAHAVARTIERMGIGGSIGIDFPTLTGKGERQAVAEAIDAALPQPFERTAVNGFGFLQIVRRRTRPSLPELLLADPPGAAVRALLRRIERDPPSALAAHRAPAAVVAWLDARPALLAELRRRTGRPISIIAS
jgi:hypothetical protein